MKYFLIKSVSILESTKSCFSQLHLFLCLRTTEMRSYLTLGYRTPMCWMGHLSGQELDAAGTSRPGTGFRSCDQLYLIWGHSHFHVPLGVFNQTSTPYSKSCPQHLFCARHWAGLWKSRRGWDQFLPSRPWQPRADASNSTEYTSGGSVAGW